MRRGLSFKRTNRAGGGGGTAGEQDANSKKKDGSPPNRSSPPAPEHQGWVRAYDSITFPSRDEPPTILYKSSSSPSSPPSSASSSSTSVLSALEHAVSPKAPIEFGVAAKEDHPSPHTSSSPIPVPGSAAATHKHTAIGATREPQNTTIAGHINRASIQMSRGGGAGGGVGAGGGQANGAGGWLKVQRTPGTIGRSTLKATAMFDYLPASSLELPLKQGGEVNVLDANVPGGWAKIITAEGRVGHVPHSFLEFRGSPDTQAVVVEESNVQSQPNPVATALNPAGPSPLTNDMMLARAVWSFEGTADNELSFLQGEEILIIQKPDDGQWWLGECGGRIGHFPKQYVKMLDAGASSSSSSSAAASASSSSPTSPQLKASSLSKSQNITPTAPPSSSSSSSSSTSTAKRYSIAVVNDDLSDEENESQFIKPPIIHVPKIFVPKKADVELEHTAPPATEEKEQTHTDSPTHTHTDGQQEVVLKQSSSDSVVVDSPSSASSSSSTVEPPPVVNTLNGCEYPKEVESSINTTTTSTELKRNSMEERILAYNPLEKLTEPAVFQESVAYEHLAAMVMKLAVRTLKLEDEVSYLKQDLSEERKLREQAEGELAHVRGRLEAQTADIMELQSLSTSFNADFAKFEGDGDLEKFSRLIETRLDIAARARNELQAQNNHLFDMLDRLRRQFEHFSTHSAPANNGDAEDQVKVTLRNTGMKWT